MRVEKAYHGWGSDFGSEYTMFDAGLEKSIDFDKADFIGREAVIAQSEQSPDWRFVRLTVDIEDAEPLPGDPILFRGKCIGYVTSASAGYRIGQCVALGYIDGQIPVSDLGAEIEVLGNARPTQVCSRAFYDPDHSRCRA
jgi:dimethylglycine dehydrogenase